MRRSRRGSERDYEEQGSTHDVGVRGPGSLGAGAGRLDHWADMNETQMLDWPPSSLRRSPDILDDRRGAALRDPQYRFGWEKAREVYYRGRPWTEVDVQLRLDWEGTHPDGDWGVVVDRVRDGYEDALAQFTGADYGRRRRAA